MIRMEDSREFIIGSNRRKAMAKYDGWTLKNCLGREPWLCVGYFHELRSDVIKEFEQNMGTSWSKERRLGAFEIVKVKLVEVA